MSTLKKDHVVGTGSAALLGGVVLGALGWFFAELVGFAGAAGLAVGAVIGGVLGAVLGSRASEAMDPREDLGHFEQIFKTMPYYVTGHDWHDYAPAYRYGLDTYDKYAGQSLTKVESQLQGGWEAAARYGSRLQWSQVRPAVAHAWESLDEARARQTKVAGAVN